MDALGIDRNIYLCRSCSFLSDEDLGDIATCPQCGQGPDGFARMPLREPLGFRAGGKRDFDGNFSWSPRAMAARALADLGQLPFKVVPEHESAGHIYKWHAFPAWNHCRYSEAGVDRIRKTIRSGYCRTA